MTQLPNNKLRQYKYFAGLSDGALEELSKRLQVTEVPEGTIIIKEGEPADSFYIVGNGEVDVIKKTNFGQDAKITCLKCGEGFGEMALLTCSPRNSSVITKTDCTFYKLLKSDFEEIIQVDSTFSNIMNNKRRDHTQYNNLKTLQPFAMLEPEKMLTLTEKLTEINYSAGEDIIKQGKDADAYYIVKSGSVAVIKQKGDEEPVQLATLTTGHAFGEEALIREEPRNATVRAIEETTVLRLEKADFQEILKCSYLDWDYPEEVEDNRDNYFLIDARIPPEYEEEHIKGAVNIPIEILRQKYSDLDPSITYRTYCLNDSRGMTAAFLMKSQGFKVEAIRGGLSGWDGQVVQGGDGIHTPENPA